MPGSPRGQVHQQDVSEQELSRTLAVQIAFLQTSCTLCAPLTCWEFDGQEKPQNSHSPQKQSQKSSLSFFGKIGQAGLLIIKVFLLGRRRSHLVMGSLIPCPAGMFAWAQPSRTSDDEQAVLSLSDTLSAGFIGVSTQPPHSRPRPFWPALPAERAGAARQPRSPLIPRTPNSRF